MNCNCGKEINEEELKYFDSLPPMQGYENPTVVRCAICKIVICRDCSWGHGCFIFTCLGDCLNKMKSR